MIDLIIELNKLNNQELASVIILALAILTERHNKYKEEKKDNKSND